MSWQQSLAQSLGENLDNCKFTTCTGGDINQSFRLSIKDQNYFVKHHPTAKKDFFKAEAFGLERLREHSPLKIPEIIYCHEDFLCLEWVDQAAARGDFYENFARGLAEQHRETSPSWGFGQHNYIGSLKQFNSPENHFSDFFWEQRLEPQIKICSLLSDNHLEQFEKLNNKLPDLLDDDSEHPALIHGDLWSGNFLCDTENKAVLIDPAVAYSHREMELAFTQLFGGFPPAFYQAYNEAYPLRDGFEDRKDLYNLYHLLTHVNLFGGSYLQQVENILNHYT